MTEYKVVEDDSRVVFEKEVETYLNAGWELHGGLVVVPYKTRDREGYEITHFNYNQVVIRKDPS